jgi:hypothetical protein
MAGGEAEEFTFADDTGQTGRPICQTWYLLPLRENFRLTPEAKQKFTEKLRRSHQ